MNRTAVIVVLAIVVSVVTSCSHRTTVESDLGIRGAPDWVNEGIQAVEDDRGRLLHGVGMAPVMNDLSLQKSTAGNRARAQIAQILSTFIDSTISDYSASTGGRIDMNIERDIRGTTELALSGVQVIAYWKDKKTGDIYAFAELDLKAMDTLVATASTLSDSFKQYYNKSVNAGFDRFVKTHQ